jgi:diguanylate cyclase (GGDEF)-like protein
VKGLGALSLAGALAFAGVAAAVAPIAGPDWLLAATILAAAIGQAEITRRTRRAGAATTAVWSVAAAVSVHLTLAVAVVLVLTVYRWGRVGVLARDAGVLAGSLVAAHFAASFGAWATPTLQADTVGVLAVVAAGAAHLAAHHALSLSLRGTDFGLAAALVITGAVVGAVASPFAVLAAVPVVVMLHSAGLTKVLETEASLDQKTGLATASSWQAAAERVFAETVPAGLLMIDLDHFKRLNDTYGHRAGDDVLSAVGACLRSSLRQTDLAGRFGGEEFTVLLPGADMMDTMASAERIRLAIAALRVTTVDKRGRHTVVTGVTASIGAAAHPHHGATVRDCLRIADNHAYQAKRQGRNTVVGLDTETSYQPAQTNPPGGPATTVAERG